MITTRNDRLLRVAAHSAMQIADRHALLDDLHGALSDLRCVGSNRSLLGLQRRDLRILHSILGNRRMHSSLGTGCCSCNTVSMAHICRIGSNLRGQLFRLE